MSVRVGEAPVPLHAPLTAPSPAKREVLDDLEEEEVRLWLEGEAVRLRMVGVVSESQQTTLPHFLDTHAPLWGELLRMVMATPLQHTPMGPSLATPVVLGAPLPQRMLDAGGRLLAALMSRPSPAAGARLLDALAPAPAAPETERAVMRVAAFATVCLLHSISQPRALEQGGVVYRPSSRSTLQRLWVLAQNLATTSVVERLLECVDLESEVQRSAVLTELAAFTRGWAADVRTTAEFLVQRMVQMDHTVGEVREFMRTVLRAAQGLSEDARVNLLLLAIMMALFRWMMRTRGAARAV